MAEQLVLVNLATYNSRYLPENYSVTEDTLDGVEFFIIHPEGTMHMKDHHVLLKNVRG